MSLPTLIDPAKDAADLIGAAPVSTPPPAPAAAPATEQPSGSAVPITNRRGQVFKPGFHKTNADGSPFINRNGRFEPINRAAPSAPNAEPAAAPSPSATPAPAAPPITEPAAPAWSDAQRAAAATPPPPAAGSPEATAAASAQVEVIDSSDDAAEVIALAGFFVIGVIFGAPEEATPPAAEQSHLIKINAALIRSTGWKGSAWWAAGLSWAAYLLRFMRKPKAAAQVQKWVAEIRAKSPAEAAAVIPDRAAAPVTAPAEPAAPARAFSGQFMERPAA